MNGRPRIFFRHHHAGRWLSLLFLFTPFAPAEAADPPDGITLFVGTGPGPDEVAMTWTGGLPMFQVYRDTSPEAVIDPGNLLVDTADRWWNDLPPPGGVFFYKVGGITCFPTDPEVCDGVDNDCDGTVDGPGSEASCDLYQAVPICTGGACAINYCIDPFGDCDTWAPNGCEANLLYDTSNCGTCDRACENHHGTTDCILTACTPVCDPDWDDCDGNPVNGCEASLTSLQHCGSCGLPCGPFPHANESCATGTCEIVSCDPGWGDCDPAIFNGCESNLDSDIDDCGSCGTACVNPHGTTFCESGTCTPVCENAWDDCDGNPVNGCETDIYNDPGSCGACDTACVNPHGTTDCGGGLCTPVCDPSWDDCDGNPVNGCETDLLTPADCGYCGNTCGGLSHVSSYLCPGGSCEIGSCDPGWADCDSQTQNGCEIDLNTNAYNCGSCGYQCSFYYSYTYCSSGNCVLQCHYGHLSCDGDVTNGCECSMPNGSEYCSSGNCYLGTCDEGWANCDGSPVDPDGCEFDLDTNPSMSSATDKGAYCGDIQFPGFLGICGTAGDRTTTLGSGYGEAWFKVTMDECSSCLATVEHTLELQSWSPTLTNYDLYVYVPSTGDSWLADGSGAYDYVTLQSIDHALEYDGFDYYVRVQWKSGHTCAGWTLRLYYHYDAT